MNEKTPNSDRAAMAASIAQGALASGDFAALSIVLGLIDRAEFVKGIVRLTDELLAELQKGQS